MARKGWERFRKIDELGHGAFGVTLLVEDMSQDGRQVVIKCPLNDDTETALINEIINNTVLQTSLKEMSHPNLVKVYGFAKYNGRFVMVMEYVRGSDLRRLIGPCTQNRRPMDLGLALRIIEDSCSGLAAAHEVRLMHSDIKPENIMVREDDDVAKLADFGLSGILRSSSLAAAMGGTYPYMAPEAWDGKASFASDIWSLCVTLYELVTGRLPFWANDFLALREVVQKSDPVPPQQHNFRVDQRLNDLILQGLEKDHKRRYRTAKDMLRALQAYRQGVDYKDQMVVEQIDQARDLFNQGKVREAEDALTALLQQFSGVPKVYLSLAELYNRGNRSQQAEDVLRKGVGRCPDNAGLHRYLAMVLYSRNKRAEAIAELSKAIELGLDKKQARDAETLLQNWKKQKG
ncbi:MAG TPA: protein kinase [Candidatus Nitrosotenuis sp.]|nr:protein kinase [Candidatus Nitrosotenuis sp.]